MPDNHHNEILKMPEDSGSRLSEIRRILVCSKIQRGITPDKLMIILEELGPTYIKLGQIMSMHSDILPEKYCQELPDICLRLSSVHYC